MTPASTETSVAITHSEYVKAGYFGVSSYTVYLVETKVPLRALTPTRVLSPATTPLGSIR